MSKPPPSSTLPLSKKRLYTDEYSIQELYENLGTVNIPGLGKFIGGKAQRGGVTYRWMFPRDGSPEEGWIWFNVWVLPQGQVYAPYDKNDNFDEFPSVIPTPEGAPLE